MVSAGGVGMCVYIDVGGYVSFSSLCQCKLSLMKNKMDSMLQTFKDDGVSRNGLCMCNLSASFTM